MGSSQRRTTSCARALPPSPPFAHTSDRATLTPSSLHLASTRSSSSLGVGRESVDRHDAGETEYVLDVVDMLEQVGKTLLQCVEVLVVEISLGNAAVILQSSYSRDNNNCGGLEACHTALDVEELLSAKVCWEKPASVTV